MGDASRVIAGRYRVDRELWRGPHARSLLATDLRNGRPCVLRRLAVAQASPETVGRFEAQAAILARLDHPGLPRFIDGFFDGEGAARERVLVTSYHPGESLDRLVDKGRALTEVQALALVRRLLSVLSYLHGFEPPLVHRFIKPTGIVVGPDGRPCLTDLDYVVAEPDTPPLAPAPPGPAELAMAAPEVFMGKPVPASDIYALGLAVLRGMTPQDPSKLLGEGLRAGLRETLGASEGFAGMLSRMLEPSLERRYADAKALEADLARLAGGKALAPARPSEPEPPPAPRRRGRAPLVAGIGLALVAILVALAVRQPRQVETGASLLAVPPQQHATASAPTAGTGTAVEQSVPSGPAPATDAVAPAPPDASPGTAGPAPSTDAAPSPDSAMTSVPPPADVEPSAPPGPAVPAATPPAPAAVPGDEANPVAVQGRLLLDGKPFSTGTGPAPNFWLRNEETKTVVRPAVEQAGDAFTVRGLAPGRYGLSVRIDLEPGNPNIFPGDLNAWTEFTLAAGKVESVDAQLRRIIRLQQPVDNNGLIPGWDVACGAGNVIPGQILFSWVSLGPGARYTVSVDQLNCARGYASAGRVYSGSVAETWVKFDLPPNKDGECYSFRLAAARDGRPIGIMATHGKTGTGWDYRFTVAR